MYTFVYLFKGVAKSVITLWLETSKQVSEFG